MSRSKAPPPISPGKSRESDAPEYRVRRTIEVPPPGMTNVRLTFDDEFSPSTAQMLSSDPEALNNPAARHLFYNQHLFDLLPHAIDRAIALGLPPLDAGFPLTLSRVDTQLLKKFFGVSNWLAQSLREGTRDWLCVNVFLRYAILCNALTEPTNQRIEGLPGEADDRLAFRQRSLDSMMPMAEAFFLGAALRELELAMLNRADALRGKKTKKAAKAGGEIRKNKTLPETDARRSEMQRLIDSGQTIANAARLTAQKVGGTAEANRALLKPSRRK